MFLVLQFFRRTPTAPQKMDTYKTEHTSDHGAKFRGDRPTELGDLAAGKKN